jgi:hypothetical protein
MHAHLRRRTTSAATLAAALVFLRPSPAAAGNEAHVRTPVVWPRECGRVVDRSVDPVTHFEYSIPVEDTMVSADEPLDSRTHQFFALCRQRPVSELLPPWITRDDLDRSVELGLVEAGEVTYREILDESTVWADCFERITTEAQRRPITFEQAALGVAWDTTGVEIGVWSVAGYTFEPPLNLWSDRGGFVKILDDPSDPEQDLPAIALSTEEQLLEPGAALELEACVDVLGPAQIELEWAPFAPFLDWQPLATIPVEDDGALTLRPSVPVAAADSEIVVRARLVDALGREYVGHAPARTSVLPCPDSGCVEDPPPNDEDHARGCSMILGPGRRSPSWLLLLVILAGCPKTRQARRPSRT